MRLRNLNEQTFKYWEEKNYVWRDRIPQRKDIYVGAPCELDSKGYAYGNIMTLGKIYIWKNLANILTSSDSAFDKFFFRAFG